MEQGPILEAGGLPLGLVTGIAGQTRQIVMISGTQVFCSCQVLHFWSRQTVISTEGVQPAYMRQRWKGGYSSQQIFAKGPLSLSMLSKARGINDFKPQKFSTRVLSCDCQGNATMTLSKWIPTVPPNCQSHPDRLPERHESSKCMH